MSTHKWMDRICVAAIVFALLLTVVFVNGENLGLLQRADKVMGYEERLFDCSQVHTIDIVMDDWDSFIQTCENEEYAACTVVIDGESFGNVGIRAKGNTSLSNVSSMGSDRYSFKIEFDQYNSGNTYHGLDKLVLNNLIQDNTMMKDYLVYQLMGEFEVDSPLCSYAYITVNGEDWGLYLAVEAIEESFLQRNYGNDYGELYKPDSTQMGGGKGGGEKDGQAPDGMTPPTQNASGSETEQVSLAAEESTAAEEPANTAGQNTAGEPQAGTTPPDGMNEEMPQMPSGKAPDKSMPNADAVAEPNGGTEPGEPGKKNTSDGVDQAGEASSRGGNAGMFGNITIDEEKLREVLAEYDMDESVLDEVDLSNLTMESVQELLAKLGDVDMQQFMQDLMDSDALGGMDDMPGGMGGGMGSDDVKLQYIDDDPDSYSNIFDNAKTNLTEADQVRLIASLKALSEGEDIESVVNVEEVIRYFVVHNYVVNGDSYTGSMVHNYYLYEKDGQLSMLPWDYNLAFGTFQGGSVDSAVNQSIDSPVSGGNLTDRPMVAWIFADEQYTELYHQYFSEFLETVDIEALISETYTLIAPYVEKDPSKFCTTEEFEVGVSALTTFVQMRSESVSRQLASDDTPVDTKDLTLSDMGTMNMGGGRGDRTEKSSLSSEPLAEDTTAQIQPPDRAAGEMTMPEQMPGATPTQRPFDQNQNGANPDAHKPNDDLSPGQTGTTTWLLLGGSAVILLGGLVFAFRFKR